MADDDGPSGKASGPDTRLEWMRSRVLSALRVKEDKFDKLITSEEGAVINNFLDGNDTTRVLIFDNGKGDLSAVSRTGKRRRQVALTLSGSSHAVPCATLSLRPARGSPLPVDQPSQNHPFVTHSASRSLPHRPRSSRRSRSSS